MRRKIYLKMVSFLPLFILFIGTSVANLNDHNTKGEDSDYIVNNLNPYDEGPAQVQGTRQRSNVKW